MVIRLPVMARLVPAIYDFPVAALLRRGYPGPGMTNFATNGAFYRSHFRAKF
jgi:hypothetical protein